MTETLRRIFALIRIQVFRFVTALLVICGYVYLWLYAPEYLKSWSRWVRKMLEDGSELLPYPWDARVEPVLISFLPWAQITLAIIAVRIVLGAPFVLSRLFSRRAA